jgi:hypothetical protein
MDTYFMNKEIWLKHCPLPCAQKVFGFNYQMFHKNNIIEPIGKAPGANVIKHFVFSTERWVKKARVFVDDKFPA